MTQDTFDSLLKERIELIKQSLEVKAKQYVRNNNTLHNFEAGAIIRGKHPTEVLDGMLLKHIICYYDMLEDIKNGKIPDRNFKTELFGDIINFFILQEIQIAGMIIDKPNEKT